MIKKIIPYAKPSVNKEDKKFVNKAMNSRWLTEGPLIEKFEEKICEYTGAKHCAIMSSGTAALDAILNYFNYTSVSSITFMATADAVKRNEREPEFCDIDLDTYLSPKAEIGTELAGRKYENELPPVIDSAHSLNRNMNMNCKARALSFHAVKNITTLGEGGAVITNIRDLHEFSEEFRSHASLHGKGANYRMTCAQAAMGISQLKRADEFKEKKQELVNKYNKELSKTSIITPLLQKDVFWHLYIIRTSNRDNLRKYLLENNVETQIHYIPVYKLKKYNGKRMCPNAEIYFNTALSLPLYFDMTKKEQLYIIELIKKWKI